MGNEREKFSQRLAHAMQQAGYEPRPTVLFHLFNTHYRGRSVSVQVLADLLGVEPHTLRFGTAPRSRVAEPRMTWPAGVGSRERQTIDAYLQLSPKKRELVGELVKALSDSA